MTVPPSLVHQAQPAMTAGKPIGVSVKWAKWAGIVQVSVSFINNIIEYNIM